MLRGNGFPTALFPNSTFHGRKVRPAGSRCERKAGWDHTCTSYVDLYEEVAAECDLLHPERSPRPCHPKQAWVPNTRALEAGDEDRPFEDLVFHPGHARSVGVFGSPGSPSRPLGHPTNGSGPMGLHPSHGVSTVEVCGFPR